MSLQFAGSPAPVAGWLFHMQISARERKNGNKKDPKSGVLAAVVDLIVRALNCLTKGPSKRANP